MCILLIYVGANDDESDYSFILASNRDEFYDRPAQKMAPWVEDPSIYGGRDLQSGCDGGTWLAVSPVRSRIGVLLNMPCSIKVNAKSRGNIVTNYLKGEMPVSDYVNSMKDYFKQYGNEPELVTYIFVLRVQTDKSKVPVIQTYCSATDKLQKWSETYLGFGNCLPEDPLQKVIAAKNTMREICTRLNKIHNKTKLVEELLNMLKSKERHLPDEQLEKTRPNLYEQLSSIFVEIPAGKYGTRTHTLILVTKTGHADVIEVTLQAPIDISNPNWERTEYQFSI